MKCVICGKKINKIGSACELFKGEHVCSKCCFSISSGDPSMVERLKKEHGYYKEDFLSICAKCIKEKESMVLMEQPEERSFEEKISSGPLEDRIKDEIDGIPDIDSALDKIVLSTTIREEMQDNLRNLIENCIEKLKGDIYKEVRELLLDAMDNMKARSINETIRIIKEAAGIISKINMNHDG